MKPQPDIAVVPCDGCVLCCQGDALRLLPEDDPTQYQTVPHPYLPGALMLAHKANDDCIYLGATGCTIHGCTPRMCRTMDCRVIAKALTWTKARKTPGLKMAVWQKGRALLAAKRNK